MRLAILFCLAVAACGARSSSTSEETLDQFENRLRQHPAPPVEVIEPLERALAKLPCVGKLERWERSYAYSVPSRVVDETVIDFKLKEAGRAGIQAGRKRTFPGAFLGYDDTPTKIAAGQFDRRTGRITLDMCGENISY